MTDRIPTGLVYLATPYSRYPAGTTQAFKDACKIAASLICTGVKVYSPIAHTHPIAVHGALDLLDLAMWIPFDEAMMEVCDVLIVVHLEGWEESVGIAHEVKFFAERGRPIFDLNPRTLSMQKRQPLTEREPANTSGEQPRAQAELVPESTGSASP